ncbi:uncharacterized protein LOC132056878 [Lycium ferocissimum]|uniref:uncharacterized protein LOC132056878 n=1 Tax=Lycium ferocissimum TaxID=112874 RepID=UPI0028149CD8|nr:uncharacterized protein LOC132056878 [Lycium ferocissimum]
MCILCSIQKWSRGVATMLPWLVIPLIGLWALSQLFPPAFRFEITSPRLACVCVLVFTLGWYEVVMPKLSSWRARRNARLRERKRFEAIEMQKLRKTATRRCRNCLTPYRDQNPGGGKFMCCYCGHISKRPILDLPVPPGLGISNSGILRDLVGNRWMYGQDWLENGNWVGGSFVSKPDSWSKTSGGFLGVDHCLAEKSYSRVFAFACKALTAFFLSIMWLCRKVFRISSSGSDASMDAERRAMMDNRGENGGNCQESKGEKARRKAEEKRLARLEKELAEEEERKQREEVARLVEERRRLRDEKMEAAEKERGKGPPSAKLRDSKREAEKKRQEKKKERDRGSSKSNSDVEELDKRQGKESARNRQSDGDRRHQHKNGPESSKTHSAEVVHGFKGGSSSSHNHGNVGTRYLDRMRGTFLSSSRAFTGGGFFGKNNVTNIPREQKCNTTIDPVHNASRRELSQPDRLPGKLNPNGDDRSMNQPVLIEPQPSTAPKKSWQQLFTRSSTPSSNVISRPSVKPQAEIQSPSSQTPAVQSFDNPISFGLPSPFTLTSFPCGPTSCSTTIPSSPRAMHPRIGDGTSQLFAEELENFEDPCYVPDPVSLLGPVCESLDDFQLEVDLGFVSDTGLDKPCAVKNVNTSSEMTRPSPIESPISRMRVPEERHAGSFLFRNTPNAQEMRTVPMNVSNNSNDVGTWQMWNSSPLGQAGLSLIGAPTNWRLSTDLNTSNVPPTPPRTMASLFKNDEQLHSVCHPPHTVYTGSCQNGGTLSTVLPGSAESRFSKAPFGTYAGGESQFSLKSEDAAQSEMTYRSPNATATNHPFASSPPNWAKKEWTSQRRREDFGSSPMASASVGGLYSTPNVQSFWSYE